MPNDPFSPEPSIKLTIPAATEVSSEYRLEQSQRNLEREGVKPLTIGGHKSKVFKQGQPLDIERSFAPALGDWGPVGKADLVTMVDPVLKGKVERDWQREGMAGVIALSDTAAGVQEEFEWDPNEVIVLGEMEKKQ